MNVNKIDADKLERIAKKNRVDYGTMLEVAKEVKEGADTSTPKFSNEQKACKEYQTLLTDEKKKASLEKQNFSRHINMINAAVYQLSESGVIGLELPEKDKNKYGGKIVSEDKKNKTVHVETKNMAAQMECLVKDLEDGKVNPKDEPEIFDPDDFEENLTGKKQLTAHGRTSESPDSLDDLDDLEDL